MEKWVKVSTGSFLGKPDLRFELPKGLVGQVYRENQYVSDVSYRFDIREVAGELVRIWATLRLSVVFKTNSDMVTNISCVWTVVDQLRSSSRH